MIRALYTAASGLVAQSLKQDITAHNIANAQTPGFQRRRAACSSFAQTLDSRLRAYTLLDRERPPYPESRAACVLVQAREALDTSPGSIITTGSKLQFAIDGPGAFVVSTGDGAAATRSGGFLIDSDGELATSDGAKVQGRYGPIRVPTGDWSVGSDGSITTNGVIVDQIKIVGGAAGRTRVMQGCMEGANVNIVSEMVEMITNVRSFEANQKVVNSVDHTLDKLINEVGRV